MSPPRTAAALVIGNELLTGKIQDTNVTVLAKLLFELGIVLDRVVICRDVVEVIVEDLNALRRAHDFVFTSGGVGPTHDDVTMAAVARAFDRRLVRAPEVEKLLAEYFGDACSERHLRMAEVPEGAELLIGGRRRWPTPRIGNVFILPGLPEVFRHKLEILREHLAGDRPFVSRAVRMSSDEGDVAELLERLSDDHPAVAIGSYPRWGEGPVRLMVTFDGRDGEQVEQAVAALVRALSPEQIVGDGHE